MRMFLLQFLMKYDDKFIYDPVNKHVSLKVYGKSNPGNTEPRPGTSGGHYKPGTSTDSSKPGTSSDSTKTGTRADISETGANCDVRSCDINSQAGQSRKGNTGSSVQGNGRSQAGNYKGDTGAKQRYH